jgi:hypothetical protein
MSPGAGVFVLTGERTLVSMRSASFATEADFQQLIAAFPELLAGDQIDAEAPRRFVLVAREQGIAAEEGGAERWSLDHLFLDQDGIPTLVEVKRGTDTRVRREVVGQMLDYAANAVLHWPVETLRARLLARCEAEGLEPAAVLADLIGAEGDAEAFWSGVRANLEAGRVRLLFVADRVPPELRRVVEFLNRQMRPAEVLAVELRQYAGQGLRTLVPMVLGQNEETARRKATAAAPRAERRWDAAAIIAAIAERADPDTVAKARRVADWIGRADRVEFNTNGQWGWRGAAVQLAGASVSTLRLHVDGAIAVYFQYMLGKPVAGDLVVRQELLDRLNAVPGVKLPPDAVTTRKTILLAPLSEAAVTQLLAVMDDFTERLREGERELQQAGGMMMAEADDGADGAARWTDGAPG